jgi:adenylate kinase family enzyme
MRRVAIIGCGGSGKTTLANELARRLEIPVVHIDSHYWRLVDGERVESTPAQWAICHRRLIAKDEWVMDGMKLGVLDERLERADTIICLDLPIRACLSGIARRRLRYRGQPRPELGVYDRITWEFLRWVWSFRRRQRPVMLAKLQAFEGQTFLLRRRRDVRRFLDTVPGQTAAATSRAAATSSLFPIARSEAHREY